MGRVSYDCLVHWVSAYGTGRDCRPGFEGDRLQVKKSMRDRNLHFLLHFVFE